MASKTFFSAEGIKIAKRIADARICSRRAAEDLVRDGKVKVNGHVVPVAHRVTENDLVTIGGKAILPMNRVERLKNEIFLCYKLRKELVTHFDPQGRRTLFQRLSDMGLPNDLISVGRLDFMSEGLILLTRNGNLARHYELPTNGYVRKYKARISSGYFDSSVTRRLAGGIKIEKSPVRYRPMLVENVFEERKTKRSKKLLSQGKESHIIDPEKSAHRTWLDISVTEGKNREVRNALEAVGLRVDRLIRTEYGPYTLHSLGKGDVRRVRVIGVDKKKL